VNSSDTLFTTAGSIAYFTINRPGAGNAMTWAMYDALAEACQRVDRDASLRVFVIRAAGGVFCTGTDISQFTSFTGGQDGLTYERRLEAGVARLEAVAVPTIAQVEGIAAGAGCVIALACDLRVCTPAARFGVPIARTLGNALSFENCARLVDHFGIARTRDLLMTGRLLDAAEAAASGIVTRLAQPAEVERVVAELAQAVAANAPLTLRATKEALRRLALHRRSVDRQGIDDLIAACYGSEDFRGAVSAFLEKRPPKFSGR
jgi:enoyl-CoA hydratase/carnithine racemase